MESLLSLNTCLADLHPSLILYNDINIRSLSLTPSVTILHYHDNQKLSCHKQVGVKLSTECFFEKQALGMLGRETGSRMGVHRSLKWDDFKLIGNNSMANCEYEDAILAYKAAMRLLKEAYAECVLLHAD